MNKLQEIQKDLFQHFDARLCPKTAAVFARKYILPHSRQGNYFDQDLVNSLALHQLVFYTTANRRVSGVDLTPIFLGAQYSRPTLFLERELGEILLDSKLPKDLALDDMLQQQFPTTRIMLPKNLLTINHPDFTESIMFIDISFIQKGERIQCPLDIAKEIDANTDKIFGKDSNRSNLQEYKLSRQYNDLPGICISGTSDVRVISYGISKSWGWETLTQVLQSDNQLTPAAIPAMDDEDMSTKIEHLGYNILILLSSVPAEYEPERIIRKAKSEGKRIIPALLQPKWVGDVMIRAKKAGMVKGEVSKGTGHTKAAHWVRPHWRRQPYGKGLAHRKLIWILPYSTGTKEDTNT